MKDVQAAQNGGSMFENKTEQQAKDEILKMVAEYCDTYHNKKNITRETESHTHPVCMITRKCAIW